MKGGRIGFAAVLTLCTMLVLFPISAEACEEGWKEVKDSAGLFDISADENVYLGNDVSLPSTWAAPKGVTLCLHGHVLSGEMSGGYLITPAGDLTITDCTTQRERYGYWTDDGYQITKAPPASGDYDRLPNGVIWGKTVGGIKSKGTLTLDGIAVAGCSSDYGGGIQLTSGTANIQNSVIAGNQASVAGGGIAVYGMDNVKTVQVTLIGTSVLNNAVTGKETLGYDYGMGGGIYIISLGPVTFRLEETSITENTAPVAGGGLVTQALSQSREKDQCVDLYINENVIVSGNTVAGMTNNLEFWNQYPSNNRATGLAYPNIRVHPAEGLSKAWVGISGHSNSIGPAKESFTPALSGVDLGKFFFADKAEWDVILNAEGEGILHEHSYGESWEMETAPTYLTEGSESQTCPTCTSSQTRAIPATGAALVEAITLTYQDGTVTLGNIPEKLNVILAAYSGERMVYSDLLPEGTTTASIPESLGADRVQAFFLTENWQPIGTSKHILT